ncbi:hypothetical protein M434DRAFT_248226 [Hypoxylon sp. CO27-5]|nr:hypothetical protein M434DRAFT_248226 [Hypoxylon sp. CO27-5]
MAPKKNDNSTSGEDTIVSLTAVDIKIIDAVLKGCLPTSKPIPTNWEVIAKQVDLKDGRNARERFRQVCKKHQWFENTVDDPATPSPSPKKRGATQMLATPTPERMVNPSSGEEGDVKGTPAKKRKTTPGKKRQAANTRKIPKVKTELDSFDADVTQGGGDGIFDSMFGPDEA